MKLTKEQTSKLLSQLNDWRKSSKPCVICGQSSWAVNDTIFELREFNEGNLVIGEKCAIMPLVPVICNNCGNTLEHPISLYVVEIHRLNLARIIE